MKITIDEMRQIHKIQLEMFVELKRVMNELNITYYFVHGSLLGAVTTGRFIEEDDDIDIAIPRDDYNKLILNGNNIISTDYFIQSSINDDFPLGFAKLRKNGTLFRQPVLERYKCHKGIYIDIFPLDYTNKNKFDSILKKILSIRIGKRLKYNKSLKYKIVELTSLLIFPSYNNAVNFREYLYTTTPQTDTVQIYGGKPSESGMILSWFGTGKNVYFDEEVVSAPQDWDAYLARIYGEDYFNHNPAQKRIINSGLIDVSADLIDFGK